MTWKPGQSGNADGRPQETEDALTPEMIAEITALDQDDAAPATQQLSLTPEQRRAYLGKLAEFEMALSELPDMQAAFVLALLKNPTNYSNAARVAGYKFADIASVKLRKKPAVAAAIALGENLREDRTHVTSERTLHEFALIAFSDITDFEVDGAGRIRTRDGVPAYATRAISSVEYDVTSWTEGDETHSRVKTKIRLWSKSDALKMLALYQKLLSGENGSNLLVDNSRHVHVHQHQHNTWQFGDEKLTF